MSQPTKNTTSPPPRRRGTVLIAMMLVVLILTTLVLVMSSTMRIEAVASGNAAAAAQADAAERAGEQYALGLLATQASNLTTLTDDYFQSIPVGDGDGSFSIVRPSYADPNSTSEYGFADEGNKLNLTALRFSNATSKDIADKLTTLTGSTDFSDAVTDWQDDDDEVTGSGGAESSYYETLVNAYRCKNLSLESLEELMLVKGVDKRLLYGTRTGPSLRLGNPLSTVTSSGDGTITPPEEDGIFDAITVYPPVLNAQQQAPQTGTTFSCEVVGVSPDSRAFKCVRIVIATASQGNASPHLLYRRDVTDGGWPWGRDDWQSLRASGGASQKNQRSTP